MYTKASDQKKVQITAGLSCNVPISTHYFANFIILSYDTSAGIRGTVKKKMFCETLDLNTLTKYAM